MLLATELEKNERTNYCADKHARYLSLAHHLGRHFDTVYDGIGGDILSAGLFLDQQGFTLMRLGKSALCGGSVQQQCGDAFQLAALRRFRLHGCCRCCCSAGLETWSIATLWLCG